MTVAKAITFEVGDSFASEFPELGADWQASHVPAPELLALNERLAADLGIYPSDLKSTEGVAILAGNATPPGARPIAMAYAGHQFGGYSPRLGDGRALLLGETSNSEGQLVDIHLKGSGRTPFARGGDGKAAVGPMLREYIMAEAMHALRIPTTRALAVVATGEQVPRERLEPGAILTRVAASHIRVGTFEYATRLPDTDVLKRLADYSIERHYPAAADSGDGRYLALLEAVVEAQASLIAQWMLVGFIHGVMNTDNVTISGETIDYGPCAFMDRYDPATVYSSIDHQGRYSYGNQPAIGQWNLIRFAETLLPLIDSDSDTAAETAKDVLTAFPARFEGYWAEGMRAKLGITHSSDDDMGFFQDLLELLKTERLDFTTSFRTLAASLRGEDTKPPALDEWTARWRSRLAEESRDPVVLADEMDEINPLYIPRNHLVEEVLDAATEGDVEPFDELLDVVTDPYVEREGFERFAARAPEAFDLNYQTFCGT